MGGGASKPDSKLNKIIKEELQLTLDSLALKPKDVVPFWKEFNKIDLDQSGQIDIDEIFESHKVNCFP